MLSFIAEEPTHDSCGVFGGRTVVVMHGLVDVWSTTEPSSRFPFDALDDGNLEMVWVDVTSTAEPMYSVRNKELSNSSDFRPINNVPSMSSLTTVSSSLRPTADRVQGLFPVYQ